LDPIVTHGGRGIQCLGDLVGSDRIQEAGLYRVAGPDPCEAVGLQLDADRATPGAGAGVAALQRPDLLGGRRPRTINMSTIGDDLLRDNGTLCADGTPFGAKIEALVVYNSNPVAVAPDSTRVARGFAREDLFTVVLEHFMTDTADLADYVLPATTQLEHLDVHTSYGHTYALVNEAAIAPLGEAKPNTQIFRELAARMGFDDPCFRDDDETLARLAFRPAAAGGAGYSCIAEQRTVETIRDGKAKTPFMRFGDRVTIEMFDADGRTIFGAIDQVVRKSG